MLNIPEVIKELFLQDGVRKNFRVHFPNGERADLVNKDIIEESVKFTESTCSQQTLRFGLTEASVIEFECVGVENIAGMTIECGIEIDVSSLSREDRLAYGTRTDDVVFPFYAVPYGVFVVDKCPRQADMKRRKVTGYTLNQGSTTGAFTVLSKKNTLTFSVENYREKIEISPNDPDAVVLSATVSDDLFIATMLGTSTTPNVKLYFRNAILWAEYVTPTQPASDPMVIRCDFRPDEYDDGGLDSAYNSVLAAVPSVNSYIYDMDGYVRLFSNTQQAVGVSVGWLRPHAIVYIRGSQRVVSYPIFIKSGEPVIININDIVPAYGSISSPIEMYAKVYIPIAWHRWGLLLGNQIDFGFNFAERERPIPRVIYKQLTPPDENFFRLTSSKIITTPDIGDYYDFSDVLGDSAASDLIEAMGSFCDVRRDGWLRVRSLARNGMQLVSRSIIESVWYEESKTPGIRWVVLDVGGEQTRITLIGTQRFSGVYVFGSTKWVPYVIWYMQEPINLPVFVKNYFWPNVLEADYTPIDLTMKGLPWLEDGDAIQIETEDGEVIDSYILRHTISGVQHLVDEIEAQGEV